MIDTMSIFEELSEAMDPAMAKKIAHVIGRSFVEYRDTVFKEEFGELKAIVSELIESQKQTDASIKQLFEAQKQTDVSIKQLTESQKQTDISIKELQSIVRELFEAQRRSDESIKELSEAIKTLFKSVDKLEKTQENGFKTLDDRITALGGRWGIYNEETFRATIRGLLSKMEGVEIHEGFYGDRQVDIVIRNGEHVLLEITSRMHGTDIEKLYRSARDYKQREDVEPVLMVATSYISPKLMKKIMALEKKIEIFSYETE